MNEELNIKFVDIDYPLWYIEIGFIGKIKPDYVLYIIAPDIMTACKLALNFENAEEGYTETKRTILAAKIISTAIIDGRNE